MTPTQAERDVTQSMEAVVHLDALAESGARGDHAIGVGGRTLKLTNVHKVLYPEDGLTKLDVARYYVQVAPYVLPHLRGRALTMKRYPDGIHGEAFYQKRCPAHRPEWVRTTDALGSEGVHYCLVQDVAALVWAANLADLELHVPLARAANPNRPTVLAFDLDPGEGADVLTCAKVALLLQQVLHALGLEALPKTSGSKGLQVYVPLNRRKVTFEQTKALAKALAQLLEREHPDLVVHRMRKALRRGKVLIDWSQNDDSKTTVCVYSLRAREGATVSTPVTWDELEAALDAHDASALRFDHEDVVARLEQHGDLFSGVLGQRQSLPEGLAAALGY